MKFECPMSDREVAARNGAHPSFIHRLLHLQEQARMSEAVIQLVHTNLLFGKSSVSVVDILFAVIPYVR